MVLVLKQGRSHRISFQGLYHFTAVMRLRCAVPKFVGGLQYNTSCFVLWKSQVVLPSLSSPAFVTMTYGERNWILLIQPEQINKEISYCALHFWFCNCRLLLGKRNFIIYFEDTSCGNLSPLPFILLYFPQLPKAFVMAGSWCQSR